MRSSPSSTRLADVYRVEWSSTATKLLAKLPSDVRKKARIAADRLRHEPRPSGCKKLKAHENAYRIRIGRAYRMVYTIDDGTVLVTIIRVFHRQDGY